MGQVGYQHLLKKGKEKEEEEEKKNRPVTDQFYAFVHKANGLERTGSNYKMPGGMGQ